MILDYKDQLVYLEKEIYSLIVKVFYDKFYSFKKDSGASFDSMLEIFSQLTLFMDIGEQIFTTLTHKFIILYTPHSSFKKYVINIMNSELFVNLYQEDQFKKKSF